jgi:hypothetical protein
MLRWALVLSFTVTASHAANLQQVRSEPNLEKRSGLALQNAMSAYQSLKAAYLSGDIHLVAVIASELEDSVKLAHASLFERGKNGRKSQKWLKRTEFETRELLRRLSAFQQDMNVNDRPLLDKPRAVIEQVNDDVFLILLQTR